MQIKKIKMDGDLVILVTTIIGTLIAGVGIYIGTKMNSANQKEENIENTKEIKSDITSNTNKILLAIEKNGSTTKNIKSLLSKLLGKNYNDLLSDDEIFNNLLFKLKNKTIEELIEENNILERKIASYSKTEIEKEFINKVSILLKTFKTTKAIELINTRIENSKNNSVDYLAQLYRLKSEAFRSEGDYLSSETALLTAVSLDSKNPEILYEYGVSLDINGKYEEGLKYFKKSLEYSLENKSKYEYLTIKSYIAISLCYLQLGENEKALEYCRNGIKYKSDIFETSQIYTTMGQIYHHKKEYSKSLLMYNKGLNILYKYSVRPNTIIGAALASIAILHLDMGNYEKFIKFNNLAINELKSIEGGRSKMFLSDAYHNRGDAQLGLHDFDGAISYYNKSIQMTIEALGENHPSLGLTYRNIGIAFLEKNENDKALNYLEKSYALFVKNFSSEHYYTMETKELLDNIKNKN